MAWQAGTVTVRVFILLDPLPVKTNELGLPMFVIKVVFLPDPSMLAWGRMVPSVRSVPGDGHTRVLSVERLCTSKGDLRTRLTFHSCKGASWGRV